MKQTEPDGEEEPAGPELTRRLPGHGLEDSRQAQRGLLLPPEGLVQLLQVDAHGAAVPAALDDQSRPEVHLTVPVRRVDVSVLLEVGEHEIHPVVIVPFRRQGHLGRVRHV